MRTILAAPVLVLCLAAPAPHPSVDIRPALATAPVTDDPDDPAIWVHPSDPARSLIVGTNKVKAPKGALVVYGLGFLDLVRLVVAFVAHWAVSWLYVGISPMMRKRIEEPPGGNPFTDGAKAGEAPANPENPSQANRS